MKLKLELELDSSSFEDCSGCEVARILSELAKKVDCNQLENLDTFPLRDYNGNKVGFANVVD
jgi:hypothetical protein